jgi:nucleotide-binding universal stress UspA family protein
MQSDEAAATRPDRSTPRLGMVLGPPFPSETEVSHGAIVADRANELFRNCLGSFRGEGSWYAVDQANAAELIPLARSVDLIIIGQANPDARPAPAWRPEAVVLACGRPVLMVPYAGSFESVGRRVLIAWDGSREATRALNDALPVIDSAEVVTVMTVRTREKDFVRCDTSMDRVVRHLGRHGIRVRADVTLRRGDPVSDVLLSRAVDLAADLIVAGAHHHSPLRESLMKSVSSRLFQRMTVPVLMSH